MWPVYQALSSKVKLETIIIQSGQHDTLAEQALKTFNLKANRIAFVSEVEKQRLGTLNSALISEFTYIFELEKPDLVLVHGDTVTAFSGGCAAFQQNIPIGHVEAGLRTSRFEYPFPEEGYRRAISRFTTLHFAPTAKSAQNLREEGINKNVFITGNTVVDSLNYIVNQHLEPKMEPFILVTCHRRESYGQPLIDLCQTLNTFKNIDILWPVHLNPNIKDTVKTHVNNPYIRILDPSDYVTFITLLKNSKLCITDSGGVMEEAAVLGVPTLVLRTETERPEVLDLDNVCLIGYDFNELVTLSNKWLTDPPKKAQSNVFGDGTAGEEIADIIDRYFHE